ncbi:hypothetical protein GCM10027590_68430 [Nocardiopsis nanhaiensis]
MTFHLNYHRPPRRRVYRPDDLLREAEQAVTAAESAPEGRDIERDKATLVELRKAHSVNSVSNRPETFAALMAIHRAYVK